MIGLLIFIVLSLWTLALIAKLTRILIGRLIIAPIRIILVPPRPRPKIIEVDLTQGEQ